MLDQSDPYTRVNGNISLTHNRENYFCFSFTILFMQTKGCCAQLSREIYRIIIHFLGLEILNVVTELTVVIAICNLQSGNSIAWNFELSVQPTELSWGDQIKQNQQPALERVDSEIENILQFHLYLERPIKQNENFLIINRFCIKSW